MEERGAKILWSKSGKGSDTTRIILPVSWIRKMGLSITNRELSLYFDEETNQIIVKNKIKKSGEINE